MFSERIDNWKKVTAGSAVFGFILSFILGIIGRVLIGAVILRAFLFAALFAGISMLVLKLIDGYIPELLSDVEDEDMQESVVIVEGSEQENGEAGRSSGNNLDITVEDDEEISYSAGRDAFEELETPDGGEIASGGLETQQAGSAGKVLDGEDVEELESVAADEDVAEGSEDTAEDVRGDLPDIGAFEDGFEQPDGSGESDGLSSIDGSGSSSAEILGSMHDTQDIVKAVQTVLKKDQEG